MLPFLNVLLRSLRPPLVRVLSFHNLDFVIIFTESHIELFTIFHLMQLLSLMVSRTITFFFLYRSCSQYSRAIRAQQRLLCQGWPGAEVIS